MNEPWMGLAGFAVLLVLLIVRIPVGVAMIMVGAGGTVLTAGWHPLLAGLKTGPYHLFSSYSLSVIPLFLLMGHFAARSGIAAGLFRAAGVWLGHRRGGVAMATIGASAGFGAICGSSLATATAMARVALPELRRLGYSGGLATATVAAGGTLGILIPPSVPLVLYALLTEQNIAKQFLAALGPGLLAAILYVLAIVVAVRVDPRAGPASERAPWRDRVRALREIGPVLAITGTVIGGIVGGWFTPTEAAAVGAAATGVLAVSLGLRWNGFVTCLAETASTTAMIFLILLGADLLNSFLALTRLPFELAGWVGSLDHSPMLVLLAILGLYLVLGCFMDSLSMLLLTIPVFFPVVAALDIGLGAEETALWFGVLAVVVVEVGLITPPIGLNVFLVNGLAKDVPMTATFRALIPFLVADLVRLGLLLVFPGLAMVAVRWLYN